MPPLKRAAAPPRKVARRARAPRIKAAPPPRGADPFAKKTGRRRTYYTGEFLAEAKRRVETTLRSTTSIAADFGMDKSVLWRLVRSEGWVRPDGSLRLRGLSPAMRVAAAVDALLSLPPQSGGEGREHGERGGGLCAEVMPPTPDPSPPLAPLAGGGESALDRLEAAVLKELSTVETMRASLGAEPLRPMDAERTARTLSTLTETLAKLRRLRLAQPHSGLSETGICDDDMPADIDEFRREFARRIELFVASRADGAGAGEAGPAGGSNTG